MFAAVNEIAVLGTACFMLALSMLWYSPYVFLPLWEREVQQKKQEPTSQLRVWKDTGITYLCYVIVVFILAVMVGYAEVLGYTLRFVVLMAILGYGALFVGLSFKENYSVRYYVITLGFALVFIIGSSLLLAYWPW